MQHLRATPRLTILNRVTEAKKAAEAELITPRVVGWLVPGEPGAAMGYLDKAQRFSSMSTSRSGGSGTADLMERAAERKRRTRNNPDLPQDPAELDRLMASIEPYRGNVPVQLLPTSQYGRLQTEHGSSQIGGAVANYVERENERQAAVDAGLENPYEHQVGRTGAQGFYLFLMPYGNKLDSFPAEVCELTYLNQLRMPKHGFDSVPDSIGNLKELKFLDLSGNAIERFPDSIGNLTNLKTLKIKENPLAPGELERLKSLLPDCKIKS